MRSVRTIGCMTMYYQSVFVIRVYYCSFFFFFSSRRRHTRSDRDWSSDVCSSDLDVERECDHGDAHDEHGVRQDGKPGPALDHQYCTLRSTNRNCSAVSTMTMNISTTDCAEEPPRSAALTPS